MFALTLDSSKCVRAVSKFATCQACELSCPTQAISFSVQNNLPSILPSACVSCGGCVGSCPSEALSLNFHSNTNFFFEYVQGEDPLLSCKKNLPCLAVLNTEHLIAMTLLREQTECDVGHCDSCELKVPLFDLITSKVDEANYILEAMESPKRIVLTALSYEPPEGDFTSNRREFLENFSLQALAKQKAAFDQEVALDPHMLKEFGLDSIDVAKIRNKLFPDKRKLLFTALKRAPKPQAYHLLDTNDLSFVSQKIVDPVLCSACQMCYRICPTGALATDYKHSKIDFDPFMCIKCHICHDVCEPHAITIAPTFSMEDFFEPKMKRLVNFTIRRCHECDSYFSYRGGEVICLRCKAEEDEAKELWGIG